MYRTTVNGGRRGGQAAHLKSLRNKETNDVSGRCAGRNIKQTCYARDRATEKEIQNQIVANKKLRAIICGMFSELCVFL